MLFSLFGYLEGLFGQDLSGMHCLFRQHLLGLSHFLQQQKTWNKTFTAYNRPKSQLKKDSIFFTNIFFILGEEKKFKPWMDLWAWVRCSHVNHPPAPTSLHYSSFFLTFSSKKLLFFDKELREGDCGSVFWFSACVCVCAGACLERNGLSPMLFDGFIKY